MTCRRIRPRVWLSVSAAILWQLTAPPPAAAQGLPSPVVEVALGRVGFADDGVVGETLAGGAARFHVTPRVSIGPELIYLRGDRHDHVIVTGNAVYDLRSPPRSGHRAVTPFIVGGAGLFSTRSRFFRDDFTSYEGAFTAGGGVRAAIGNRWSAGVDARVGWELHVRVNAVIGVQLGP